MTVVSQSCFRAYFEFEEILYSKSIDSFVWSHRIVDGELLPLYLQFEIAEKSLRFTTILVIIELGFVRSCYVVTSGTKRATSYSEIRNFLPALIRWVLIR